MSNRNCGGGIFLQIFSVISSTNSGSQMHNEMKLYNFVKREKKQLFSRYGFLIKGRFQRCIR